MPIFAQNTVWIFGIYASILAQIFDFTLIFSLCCSFLSVILVLFFLSYFILLKGYLDLLQKLTVCLFLSSLCSYQESCVPFCIQLSLLCFYFSLSLKVLSLLHDLIIYLTFQFTVFHLQSCRCKLIPLLFTNPANHFMKYSMAKFDPRE